MYIKINKIENIAMWHCCWPADRIDYILLYIRNCVSLSMFRPYDVTYITHYTMILCLDHKSSHLAPFCKWDQATRPSPQLVDVLLWTIQQLDLSEGQKPAFSRSYCYGNIQSESKRTAFSVYICISLNYITYMWECLLYVVHKGPLPWRLSVPFHNTTFEK